MKCAIIVILVLMIGTTAGFMLAGLMSHSEKDDQQAEDQEQMEYLRRWEEKHRRS